MVVRVYKTPEIKTLYGNRYYYIFFLVTQRKHTFSIIIRFAHIISKKMYVYTGK